jgi:hypothetical protein
MRLALLLALAIVIGAGAQQPARPGQTPARDTSAQPNQDAPAPTGSIVGRVIAADTGRPIKRARVTANASELPGGRGMLTDDRGAFELTGLPAGRYTVNVSKSGFVSLSYGQRRPLQPGTPLQLSDGQQLKGVDFSLPRGSVITGTVLDDDGDMMPGVDVRVLRYQFQQGERRLVPAGNGQTDDRGQYRVWGLMPGDYYVSATARNNIFNFGGRGLGPLQGPGRGSGAGPGGRGGAAGGNEEEQLAYAPTYFPGVGSADEAKAVTVGLGQEVVGINFNLLLVHTSRISGRVTNPDGSAASGGNVNLGSESGRAPLGGNLGGRITGEGSFSIANVPPGRYVLRARGMPAGAARGRGQGIADPLYGSLPLSVNGQDIDTVTVQLAAGATISGTIVLPPGQAQPDAPTQMRVTAPAVDPDAFGGPASNASVDKDGRFTLTGVPEGPHLIRVNGGLRGMTLKSVTVGGREVTDAPIQVRSGQRLTDVTIALTDKVSQLEGMVTNAQNAPASEYTMLVFPTDSSLWHAQSRQIQTTRPDQTGKFRIRGLPPGDYFLVAVDPAEPGEWFDPAYLDGQKTGATRFMLGEGQTLTQDIRIK